MFASRRTETLVGTNVRLTPVALCSAVAAETPDKDCKLDWRAIARRKNV